MDFFYDLLGGLQDLDLHLLLAQQPLEFPDPVVGFSTPPAAAKGSLRRGLEQTAFLNPRARED